MKTKLGITKDPVHEKWVVTLRPADRVLQLFSSQPAAQRYVDQVLSSGTGRWRCCITGCNPQLKCRAEAEAHKFVTGHRVAAWPKRSKEGQRRARQRNRSGYYDKYNVGHKARGFRRGGHSFGDEHPFSEEAVQG